MTLALIFAAKCIFESDYVRPKTAKGTLKNDTPVNGDLNNPTTVLNGESKVEDGTVNGEVSATNGDDSITIARKALSSISEGIQEKVSALVNSATSVAKSTTDSNVSGICLRVEW